MKFRVTWKTNWLFISSIWNCFLAIPLLILLSFINDGSPTIINSLKWGLFIALPFALPQVLLHLNYFFINKGDVLECSADFSKFAFRSSDLNMVFHMSDILKVFEHESFNMANHGIMSSNFDHYSHCTIHLSDGSQLTLTCLLVPSVNKQYFGDKLVLKKNIYRWAKGHKIKHDSPFLVKS